MDKNKVAEVSEAILGAIDVIQPNLQANIEELSVAILSVLGGLVTDSVIQLTQDQGQRVAVVAMSNAHNFAYLTDITNQMLAQQSKKETE